MRIQTASFLKALKSKNLAANVPSVSPETGALLESLVKERGTRSLLELWTAHGYSTVTLASAMSEAFLESAAEPPPNATHSSERFDKPRIVTVDFSKPSFDAAVANVREAGFEPLVEHVFADALAFVPSLSGRTFDAVFLDAEKRSTKKLFELAWPLVAEGGWLVVDDVVKFKSKMADFYEYLERSCIPHEIVMTDPDDGVMVFRK